MAATVNFPRVEAPHLSLLVLLALSLHVCGETPPAPTTSGATRTTVIVMRHCVRSTPSGEVMSEPNYPDIDNYTEFKWPPFSVPPWFCLPRGGDIVEGQGRWWRARGGLEPPVRVVADLIPRDEGQRDRTTMQRFLKGLGLEARPWNVSLDHGPFWPCSSSECDRARPSASQLLRSAEQHLRENPPPAEYAERLRALYAALGNGTAGDWTGVDCTITPMAVWGGLPMPTGGCQAAAVLAQRLLMELGGGMELGWGRVRPEQVPEFLQLHSWHFYNWLAPAETHRYFGASMARNVLSHLDAAEGGTRLFVGHDSDIMMLKSALGLTWEPEPYPTDAVTPGSMLRLVRKGDRVKATFFYVQDFGKDSGEMAFVNATFASSSSAKVKFAAFSELLQNGSIRECACGGAAAGRDRPEALVV